MALKRTGFGGRLVGVSRPATIARALELGVVDEGWGYDELERALKGADLVFICTPIKRILTLIAEVGQLAEPGTLVTDVGSTKRRIVAAAKPISATRCTLSAATRWPAPRRRAWPRRSRSSSRMRFYILVPDQQVPADRYQALTALLRQLGARVMELDAGAHDRAVAAISHLPQMLATSLVGMVGRLNAERDHFLPLAAGGFRDLTRIASSPFAPVWGGYLRDQCRTRSAR